MGEIAVSSTLGVRKRARSGGEGCGFLVEETSHLQEYAKYGVVLGRVLPSPFALTCGIVSTGWPAFALAARARGWGLRCTVLGKSDWAPWVRKMFGEIEIVEGVGEAVVGLGCRLVPQVWLCDMEPSRSLKIFGGIGEHKPVVISLRRFRQQVPLGYKYRRICLLHQQCGGVSDRATHFHIYHALGKEVSWEVKAVASRDLNSVVDPKVSGYPCPAPRTAPLGNPQVVQIRPNTYHVGGLYPSSALTPRFVAPCVFSQTGWVRRYLSGREMCEVLDVPPDVRDSLSSGEISTICKESVVPGKVATKMVDLASSWILMRSKGDNVISQEGQKKVRLGPGEQLSKVNLNVIQVQPVELKEGNRKLQATKADDAEIPEYLWNSVLVPDGDLVKINKLSVLRNFALRWVKRELLRSFLRWFHGRYPHVSKWKQRSLHLEYSVWRRELAGVILKVKESAQDWAAGRDCIHRFAESSWWDWPAGSRPHFWRWAKEYSVIVRDGVPPWLTLPLPRWLVPQRAEKDPNLRAAMRKKLDKVRKLRYICPGEVKSLTSFFAVPKGENDIRMVYDGTKSGLNDAMWAPWFALPTIESHLRFVAKGSFMGDLDIGDMFHNFVLHDSLKRLAGIDVTPFYPEELREGVRVIWQCWQRCAMGLKKPPYNSVQGILFAEEIIRGDHKDSRNVFRWSFVRLNLPGSLDYKPHLPWVSKIRGEDGKMANDFITYVDDTRSCGNSWEEARLASRTVASRLNWLGIQDAARKRRDPSQDPGPWAGSVVHVSEEGAISVSVTQERWDKTKGIVEWIYEEMLSSDTIEFKTLQRSRGFLVYVGRTYPVIVPYLKGIHLTLDSWRAWRKEDGWKLSQSEINQVLVGMDPDQFQEEQKAPLRVKWVPRLKKDIDALRLFTGSENPPKRLVRPLEGASVVYTFGDASGSGFGGSSYGNEELRYYSGQWEESYSSKSSNYRELSNLVIKLENDYVNGLLENKEIFVFTDNSTAEAAYFKGTSKSQPLFELILRLQFVHMHAGMALHFVHVAGQRMMDQGTDGLSRGSGLSMCMTKGDFLQHIPLNLGVLDRQPVEIRDWVDSWFHGPQSNRWLCPEDWFLGGQTEDRCIWTPPPAAADAALEQLARSIHKRPRHTHLVLIPRLMTALWRKLLYKICDVVFSVPPGTEVWHDSQCEPVIVGLYLPLSRHPPWRLKGSNLLVELESQLYGLQKDDFRRSGFILRQFLQQTRALERMSASMVWEVLQGIGPK